MIRLVSLTEAVRPFTRRAHGYSTRQWSRVISFCLARYPDVLKPFEEALKFYMAKDPQFNTRNMLDTSSGLRA